MPTHITALYPFVGEECLSDAVLVELRRVCGELPVLDVEFRRTGRFPGVLFLHPEPVDRLGDLTAAIAARWPEAPPYGGRFKAVIPHLTVAHGAGGDVLAEIEEDVLRGLPIRTRLVEACLYVFDGAQWRPRARLPFQSPRSDA